MHVVDASLVVHALTDPSGGKAWALLVGGQAVAPHLLDIEVVHALRKAHRRGEASDAQVREAIAEFESFPITRRTHEILLGRIWLLRHNVSTYDATYVALAEHLQVPLLTRDRRLANSSGHTARIEYID